MSASGSGFSVIALRGESDAFVAPRIRSDLAWGALYFAAAGAGGAAAVQFATLQGAPVISASDFSVI